MKSDTLKRKQVFCKMISRKKTKNDGVMSNVPLVNMAIGVITLAESINARR